MSSWLRGLELDLRSLALFRITLGSCLVADLFLRFPYLREFYTDGGVLPRRALVQTGDPWSLSLHLASGEWAIQACLFLLTLLFAVGFTVGYRTRLCTLGAWVLVVSMHVRNPLIVHGGDSVLRLLLFWSIFLPLNARWSVDLALNKDAPRLPDRHLSPAGAALIFQLCAIYWYAFASKSDPVWLVERSAVYYALNLDMFTAPLGRSLLAYPALLRAATVGTLVLEAFGPILAIVPVYRTTLRLAAVGLFIAFHLGLALSMTLGLFPWICIAGWLALLPGPVWDRLARVPLPRAPGRAAAALVTKLQEIGVSAPAPRRTGTAGNVVVLTALLVVTSSLLFASPRMPGLAPSDSSFRRRLYSVTALGQQWRMFAPRPTPDDGWYVLEGVHTDGSRVDLWTGRPPVYDRPEHFQSVYPSALWLTYLSMLWNPNYAPFRPYVGRYLCRTWNEAHPGSEVTRVILRFMLERTPRPGEPMPAPTRNRVDRYYCSENEAAE